MGAVRLLPLFVAFLALLPLQAQDEIDDLFGDDDDDAPAAQTQQGAAPTPPAGQWRQPRLPTQSPPASRPGLNPQETIPGIQFPNGDVRGVLDLYEKLTGKQLIYDGTVQGQVNIVVSHPITVSEAVQMIETALLVNGFTLVPGPGRIVKVLGASKNPRQFAVPIFSNLNDLPLNDQIVSFMFELEYANPVEVQQVLAPYVAPSPYTWFQPLPKSQAIIVTESANVIRMLAKVITELDEAPAEVVSQFFPLARADAKDVVEKLTEIFDAKKEGTPGTPNVVPSPFAHPPPGTPPGQQPGNQGSTGITLSEDAIIIGKIKLTADVRTNRIHVVTRPVNLPFIRRLIEEYDSDVVYGEPLTRKLRYVAAGDLLDIVVNTILEPGVEVNRNGAGAETTRTTQNNQRTTTGGGGSGTGSASAPELEDPNNDTAPISRIVGNSKIIADRRANAIIVLGNEAIKTKIARVLDEMDVRTPQVMLTAVVGELILNDEEEFGIDYIQSLGRRQITTTDANGNVVTVARPEAGFAGIARNTGAPLLDLGNLTNAASLAGAGGGVTAFIGVTRSLELIVRALEGTGRFRVTSRPMVFASNNRRAFITSGQQIAVPRDTVEGFSGNNSDLVTRSSIDYKDVALKLEIVPLINSKNEVTLDIIQEVNTVSGSSTVGGNSVPTINTRKISTAITVANEATIVLGGLVQESKEKATSAVPVLGKIPGLGKLFRHDREVKRRTELIVLIRPTISHSNDEDIWAGEAMQERFHLPPDLEATLDPRGADANVKTIEMKPPKAQPRSGQ